MYQQSISIGINTTIDEIEPGYVENKDKEPIEDNSYIRSTSSNNVNSNRSHPNAMDFILNEANIEEKSKAHADPPIAEPFFFRKSFWICVLGIKFLISIFYYN